MILLVFLEVRKIDSGDLDDVLSIFYVVYILEWK